MSEYKRDRTNWIETFTGKQFWPLDPRPEEIDIRDIAHALAMQCRFTGHCLRFASVAEHCVLASRLVPSEWAREALLHDAPETYIHDMASPIKRSFGGYKDTENKIEAAVITRYGLKALPWPVVKGVDMRLAVTERDRNMTKNTWEWDPIFDDVAPYISLELPLWSPIAAEFHFLERAKELGIK